MTQIPRNPDDIHIEIKPDTLAVIMVQCNGSDNRVSIRTKQIYEAFVETYGDSDNPHLIPTAIALEGDCSKDIWGSFIRSIGLDPDNLEAK